MNVILLALSTFNPSNKMSKNDDGKDEVITVEGPFNLRYKDNEQETELEQYNYQLEPVLNLYRYQNKKVATVIYLYTKKTTIERKVLLPGEAEYRCVSEEKYFKELVETKLGNQTNCIPIEVSQDKKKEAVKNVIGKIRSLKDKSREHGEDFSLSIDIHGGLRDTQMMIQSIITLLRFEDITPDKTYTVTLDKDTSTGTIKTADETYDINNYVAAMSEFFTYGRSRSLEEYYSRDNSSGNKLVEIIKKISDSIQLCHMTGFDAAIKEMSDYIDKEHKDSGDYDDIFIETIKQSYGVLMEKDERNKVINKVRWCVDHDFVQQALTIIESLMPEELRERKVIEFEYADKNKETVKVYRERGPEAVSDKTLSEVLEKTKPQWESEINYTLIRWVDYNLTNNKHEPSYDNRIEISGLCKNKYLIKPVEQNWNMEKYKWLSFRDDNNTCFIKLKFKINPRLADSGKQNVARLLALHLALKDCRNGVNHAASGNRPGVEEVKVAIYAYVDLANSIFNELNKYVLAMYDVRGKQEFIFRTNKLQEIVGASWLIRDVFKDYLFPAAKKYKAKGIYSYVNTEDNSGSEFSVEEFEKRINSNEYIGEVVYEGGGNIIVLFKDEDTFKEITYRFTKKVMEEVGTLRVLGTAIEIDAFNDYAADRAKLYKKHRIAESEETNISPWSCIPIAQVDRKTSQPLVDYTEDPKWKDLSDKIQKTIKAKGVRGKLTKESYAKLKKFHVEFERIRKSPESALNDIEKEYLNLNEKILDKLVEEKGKDSNIAVVYIDGNSMGSKVTKRIGGMTTYEDCIKELRDFSKEIQDTYVEGGVKEALKNIKDGSKPNPDDDDKEADKKDVNKKAFRIVVSAGDEINFIVRASDAFCCAQNYLNYLKEKYNDDASACAGIAVFNSHAPYADAYRIAEEACESGKQMMKKLGMENAAFIDFHIIQGAIGTSLDDIRNEENGKVISRPWLMWTKDKNLDNNALQNVTDFDKEVQFVLDILEKGNFSRSNIKELAFAAKSGDAVLKTELNRMYSHLKKKDEIKDEWKQLKEMEPEKLRNILYDISISYDFWFSKGKTVKGDKKDDEGKA